jgi:GntR family transcriptional regulator, rspAB operon transcriptional repressor
MGATLSIVGRGAAFAPDARVGRQSKVDKLYWALKEAIVSGALAPDTSIDKGDWGARFEVSRLSVTSAVNRLAFERLVVIEPQRGSYVARIRLADVKQWMLVRRALESEVVAACARELSEKSIERLRQNLAYQRAALDSGDLQGFHDLDTRFHGQMAEGLSLARVTEVLDPVRTHLERVRRMLLPEPGRIEGTFVEHRTIFRTILEREAEAARRAIGAHLDRVLRELESFAARHPGYFEA